MANERVRRKELWVSLGSIKKPQVWQNAAGRLGLIVTSGSKHRVIRRPEFPIDNIEGFVSTIQNRLDKQVNQGIFTNLLDAGFSEDEVWSALDMLKSR